MRIALIVALSLFAASPAFADDAPPAAAPATPGSFMARCGAHMPSQVPLDAALIEKVIKSYDDVRAYAKTHKAELDAIDKNDNNCPPDLSDPAIANTPVVLGFNDIVKGYGFDNFKQWTDASFSVMSAYHFADHPAPAMDASKMASMPPDVRAQMAQSMAMMAKMQPSPENVVAITPYKDQLAALQSRIEADRE